MKSLLRINTDTVTRAMLIILRSRRSIQKNIINSKTLWTSTTNKMIITSQLKTTIITIRTNKKVGKNLLKTNLTITMELLTATVKARISSTKVRPIMIISQVPSLLISTSSALESSQRHKKSLLIKNLVPGQGSRPMSLHSLLICLTCLAVTNYLIILESLDQALKRQFLVTIVILLTSAFLRHNPKLDLLK
jgi:hypothetical protein